MKTVTVRELQRRSAPPEELIARRQALPRLDPGALRRDIEEALDSSL